MHRFAIATFVLSLVMLSGCGEAVLNTSSEEAYQRSLKKVDKGIYREAMAGHNPSIRPTLAEMETLLWKAPDLPNGTRPASVAAQINGMTVAQLKAWNDAVDQRHSEMVRKSGEFHYAFEVGEMEKAAAVLAYLQDRDVPLDAPLLKMEKAPEKLASLQRGTDYLDQVTVSDLTVTKTDTNIATALTLRNNGDRPVNYVLIEFKRTDEDEPRSGRYMFKFDGEKSEHALAPGKSHKVSIAHRQSRIYSAVMQEVDAPQVAAEVIAVGVAPPAAN